MICQLASLKKWQFLVVSPSDCPAEKREQRDVSRQGPPVSGQEFPPRNHLLVISTLCRHMHSRPQHFDYSMLSSKSCEETQQGTVTCTHHNGRKKARETHAFLCSSLGMQDALVSFAPGGQAMSQDFPPSLFPWSKISALNSLVPLHISLHGFWQMNPNFV